jgi:putative oxidoreductase
MEQDSRVDLGLLIGRVALSLVFVMVGFGVMLSPDAFARGMKAYGLPFPDLLPWVEIAINFFGGLVLLAGFRTRLLSGLFIVFVVVAALAAHHFWTMTVPAERAAHFTHFWKDVAIIGGLVMLIVTGGGRYSLDHLVSGRGSATAGA